MLNFHDTTAQAEKLAEFIYQSGNDADQLNNIAKEAMHLLYCRGLISFRDYKAFIEAAGKPSKADSLPDSTAIEDKVIKAIVSDEHWIHGDHKQRAWLIKEVCQEYKLNSRRIARYLWTWDLCDEATHDELHWLEYSSTAQARRK
jgi:hypothetical protein